jgi:hypothetical protein
VKRGQTIHFPWTGRLASIAVVMALVVLLWLVFTSPEFRDWVGAFDDEWRPILRRTVRSVIFILIGAACLVGATIGLVIDVIILNSRG